MAFGFRGLGGFRGFWILWPLAFGFRGFLATRRKEGKKEGRKEGRKEARMRASEVWLVAFEGQI